LRQRNVAGHVGFAVERSVYRRNDTHVERGRGHFLRMAEVKNALRSGVSLGSHFPSQVGAFFFHKDRGGCWRDWLSSVVRGVRGTIIYSTSAIRVPDTPRTNLETPVSTKGGTGRSAGSDTTTFWNRKERFRCGPGTNHLVNGPLLVYPLKQGNRTITQGKDFHECRMARIVRCLGWGDDETYLPVSGRGAKGG